MSGNSLLMTQGCFWASHPDVLPYFVRSALIQHQAYFSDFTPELRDCVALPINEFADRVVAGKLPEEFRSTEAAGLAVLDGVQKTKVLMGMFYSLQLLETTQVKFNWVDVDQERCTSVLRHKILYTIPSLKQPIQPITSKLCSPYKDVNEVSTEIKGILQSMAVEFPENFPFQAYTGILKGLIAIPTVVAR